MKNTNNEFKKEKRGMYIALGICLVSVALAGIGTYSGIQNFVDSVENNTTKVDVDDDEDDSDDIGENDPEPYSQNNGDDDNNALDNDSPEVVNNDDVGLTDKNEDDDKKDEKTEDNSLNNNTNEPISTETAKNTYKLGSSFMYPVGNGNITTDYSDGNLVYNSTMGDYRVHSGIDISCGLGDTVYSCNAGKIISCFNDLLLGNVVIIEHGEYEFWYCGLGDTFLVEEGEIIADGTEIGSVKEVPSEKEGTHIHLQIMKDGEFINPNEIDFK